MATEKDEDCPDYGRKENAWYTKRTLNKGRGLFAKHSIKEGDEILLEKPIVCCQFSWNTLYRYTACGNCMKSLETAEEMARRLSGKYDTELPHKECCEIERSQHLISKCQSCDEIYCCEECKIDAYEKYHKILCLGVAKQDPNHPLNKLDQEWRESHYPPETASIGLVCRIIAVVIQAEDASELLEQFASFCSSPQNIEEKMVHKLLGDCFNDHVEILRNMLLNTLYDDKIRQWLTPDGFRSLLAMIGMNGQGIGTSSLSQYVHNIDALAMNEEEREVVDAKIDQLYDDIDKESGHFLNCEGSGLYLTQVVEICICYLDECQRQEASIAAEDFKEQLSVPM
eukprot:gene18326-20147_t